MRTQARHRFDAVGEDVVLSGFEGTVGLAEDPGPAARARAAEVLAALGVAHLARRHLLTLSYGELRKLLVARALAPGPEVLLLDEPLAGLDAASRDWINRAVAQAFDAEGRPTQAALGFARSQGVDVAALERKQTPKGERLAVTKVEKGRAAKQVLPALLERLVAGLKFRKSMRSRYDDVTFARPVRWIVALLGGQVLKVRFGEVVSGGVTYGHRFKAPKAIKLTGKPEDYVAKLRKAFVVVDPAERRALVVKEVAKAAKAK